jgi:hypothetical protein
MPKPCDTQAASYKQSFPETQGIRVKTSVRFELCRGGANERPRPEKSLFASFSSEKEESSLS